MTTWTETDDSRRSAAPTVSAARPPGPEMLPYPGPARPSFPAGATTRVSSRSAPATAQAEGLSLKAARQVPPRPRAPPSPRRAPRRRRSGRPHAQARRRVDRSRRRPPSARPLRAWPAARIGIDAPRAIPFMPAGPSEPTIRPAICVPCRSKEAGRVLGARGRSQDGIGVDDVVSLCHLSEQVRMPRLHTGVEEGDGHTPSVEAQRDDVRTRTGAVAVRSRSASRTRRPDRRCNGPDRRRRPQAPARGWRRRRGGRAARRGGQHAGIPVLGADLPPSLRETGDRLVVGRKGRNDPLPLLRRLAVPPAAATRSGEGRAVEDDDHTLADRDLLTRRPD